MYIYKIHGFGRKTDDNGNPLYFLSLEKAIKNVEQQYEIFCKENQYNEQHKLISSWNKNKTKLQFKRFYMFYGEEVSYIFETIIKIPVNE